MPAYVYHQSNSGGRFRGPAVRLIVEADSHEDADSSAVYRAGIYFDGVRDGMDCDCCGDRWASAEWGSTYPTVDDALDSLRRFFSDKETADLYLSDGVPFAAVLRQGDDELYFPTLIV